MCLAFEVNNIELRFNMVTVMAFEWGKKDLSKSKWALIILVGAQEHTTMTSTNEMKENGIEGRRESFDHWFGCRFLSFLITSQFSFAWRTTRLSKEIYWQVDYCQTVENLSHQLFGLFGICASPTRETHISCVLYTVCHVTEALCFTGSNGDHYTFNVNLYGMNMRQVHVLLQTLISSLV